MKLVEKLIWKKKGKSFEAFFLSLTSFTHSLAFCTHKMLRTNNNFCFWTEQKEMKKNHLNDEEKRERALALFAIVACKSASECEIKQSTSERTNERVDWVKNKGFILSETSIRVIMTHDLWNSCVSFVKTTFFELCRLRKTFMSHHCGEALH